MIHLSFGMDRQAFPGVLIQDGQQPKGPSIMGHASVVVEHAEESMKHLKMAQAEGENPHLTAAAKGLEEAIEEGNMGHAELATKGAAEAVRHLEMIE